MLSKIKDVLIIVNKGQIENFKKILPNGNDLGMNIKYIEQKTPKGLPDAFILGEKFINNQPVALILGDNFFYGQSLTQKLIDCTKIKKGARVFLHAVRNPSAFGVATVNKKKKITKIVEKPLNPKSNLAVTGLYFFDKSVVQLSKSLKPSKRNELEIVDLLNKYKKKNQLSAEIIGRGGTWLDTGTIKNFYNTTNFISAIEERQGFKIGCIEEIALTNNWIKKKQILKLIKFYGKCDYSNYLSKLI